MISIRKIENREEWDAFFVSCPYRYFVQSWEWGDFLLEYGKSLERVGIYEEEKLVGIAQIILEQSRVGKVAYMSRGPVLDWQNVSLDKKEILRKLIDHLRNIGGVISLRIDPPVLSTDVAVYSEIQKVGFHKSLGFWLFERSWVLDLKDKTEEQILMDMRKNTRYDIRKAMKSGIEIAESRDKNDMIEFVDMLHELGARKGFAVLPKKYLLTQFDHMVIKNNQFKFYIAKLNGKMIAGAVVSFLPYEAGYIHGASRDTGDSQAPYLLQWRAITDAIRAGIPIYNFWGVVAEKDYHPGYPGYGYSNFKKGFGGRLVEFIGSQDYTIDWLRYSLFYLQELYRSIRYKGN